MKAMLYLDRMDQPVSVLDEVKVVDFDSANHPDHSHHRVFYKTKNLNATKTMVDLHRDRRFVLKLEDGRTANVLLQHSSIDMQGHAVGVLRILGNLS